MKKTAEFLITASIAGCFMLPGNTHAGTAEEKLGRGMAGICCGILELPGNIVEQTREKGGIGVPIGMAYGLGMTVTRELVGVYEVLSAPFPMPPGFRPILNPKYPWSYFH
jgi:putative exosortase-associated protein (TIGR04073 family)